MATEYIFEKDFWGNWKLVPREKSSGSFVLFIILLFLLVLTLVVLTLPLWLALLGFKMVKNKRFWAGIASVLGFIYFLVDLNKEWLSSIWFYGWKDSSGEFVSGFIGEEYLPIFYAINGIGLFIAFIFTVQALSLKKSSRI